jgi:hypothetical protein
MYIIDISKSLTDTKEVRRLNKNKEKSFDFSNNNNKHDNEKCSNITSPKSVVSNNTDKLAPQNIMNKFMSAAVAAATICNNNNSPLNLASNSTGLQVYLSQLMGSDLSTVNNQLTVPSNLSLPNHQQVNQFVPPDLMNDQAKIFQNTRLLEPLLQCSNYFKLMENYQKYASNYLNQNNTNSSTGFSAQAPFSVSNSSTAALPAVTTDTASSYGNNGNSTTANRVSTATSTC